MKAFQEQQKQYIEQTNKAKAELSAARRNLQALNKLAGLQTSVNAQNMPDAQELEEGVGDSEATEAALTKQVQDCLKQAASIINPPMCKILWNRTKRTSMVHQNPSGNALWNLLDLKHRLQLR